LMYISLGDNGNDGIIVDANLRFSLLSRIVDVVLYLLIIILIL